jgi:hypothetical protein
MNESFRQGAEKENFRQALCSLKSKKDERKMASERAKQTQQHETFELVRKSHKQRAAPTAGSKLFQFKNHLVAAESTALHL